MIHYYNTHYNVKMCCTETIEEAPHYLTILHYHIKMCCTAPMQVKVQLTRLLHYHVKSSCTATAGIVRPA